MKKLAVTLLAAAMTIAAAEAATVTTASSRSAYLASITATGAGPVVGVNFNGFSQDVSFERSSVDVGPITISTFIANDRPRPTNTNIIDALPLVSIDLTIDRTPAAIVALLSSDLLILTFDAPTSAFGADFRGLGPNVRIFVAGVELSLPSSPEIPFFGFVSDMPFSRLEFFVAQDGQRTFLIDNIAVASAPDGASVVPLPLSWPLFLSGIILLLRASNGRLGPDKREVDVEAQRCDQRRPVM